LNVATVVGARPQFIKAAVVSRALRLIPTVEEVLIHTGQHYDDNMSAVFFEELEIPRPEHHLSVGSSSHGAQTGRMLQEIEKVLLETKPDWVLVFGDTNSTLAGALAAAKLHIPVAHVEAGLRCFNRRMPEEINRVLTDHASDLLFAPTEAALENLRREGISGDGVRLVGDVMYDAALYYGAKAEQRSAILSRLGLEAKGYVLASVHRAENTDDAAKLRSIVEGLLTVGQALPVVLPLHPRTRAALAREAKLEEASRGITLIDPVGYLDMVMLESKAALIATDSGGIQKEAFFHGVPCVTLREETEWVELVDLGWNVCAAPRSRSVVYECILRQLSIPATSRSLPGMPYGKGDAGLLIANQLAETGRS
jgi:UDP-GlcNAc3NAcA epimerase